MLRQLIFEVVRQAFTIYSWLLIARIILSWIGPAMSIDWSHPIVRWLVSVTEPVLGWARRIIPPLGMIDISPILVFIALQFVESFVLRMLVILFWG